MGKIKDLIGNKYGKLTVTSNSGDITLNRGAIWTCKCDCGNVVNVNSRNLITGSTKSCGCLYVENSIIQGTILAKNNTTHGASNTAEYRAWEGIKRRCSNLNNPDYHNYGGRGIKVCDRWLDQVNGFINFLADMGLKPSPDHSIDRYPDNDGNYEPSNCRWATPMEQANNTRSNVFYEYKGKQYTGQQISKEFNINIGTFRNRLYNGWSLEKAIETPVNFK